MSTPSQNAQTMGTAMIAFSQGDMETFYAALHPEVEWHVSPMVPWGGVYKGADGVKKLTETFMSYWAEVDEELELLVDGDEHIVTVLRSTGKLTNGREFTARSCVVYEMRDGKIARFETFGDTAEILEALGDSA